MALIPYFEFNGKSTRDFGLTIGRGVEIGYPDKNKKIEPLAWTNVQYDFSNLYGSQQYTNRLLKFPIHIMNKSESSIYFQNTKILNWLMSVGRQPFYYSEIPGYYFMAEVVSDVEYDLRHVHDGVLEIVFECYPFMIDRMPEGHDIWDLFNFDLDVSQPTKFTFKSNWTNFKQLNVGDMATYGAWSKRYSTDNSGNRTRINQGILGTRYKIVDKKTIPLNSMSRTAYKLGSHDDWLIEQDIVEAQEDYLDIVVVNPGLSEIAPQITINRDATIVRGNEIYNLQPGVYKTEQFVLNSGENKMQVYFLANSTLEIDFNFHKELI